ncbi:M90 family metallopeptidase [Thiohalophilus sp.]|uniref:M90 family metallopeptidase n=1 Tax=Thiohalophilus sp. TaxID=3028392 RepID=UPI002ACD3286|nr:M90 family metallopeptidase [Thiohalophilus sp.]MDZ7660786.1 M90 family metallopeptidase [Thiohalophilus sp.]
MLNFLKQWREQRIIRRAPYSESEWRSAFERLPLLDRLSGDEKMRLRRLAVLFLHGKSLEGAGDLMVTNELKLVIALQACLPILNLGRDWYDGWVSVVIYRAGFTPMHSEMDEYGIVHRVKAPLNGESWERGPVVLSADAALEGGAIDGHNLVIHEFAHKLDMQNGVANGMPPLHREMSAVQWNEVFSAAYADLRQRIAHGKPTPIDHYAATAPAEFFAVLSEVFFERPAVLRDTYPGVYRQLQLFYRQNPLDT